MKNFLFAYKGGSGMPEGKEAQDKMWAAWSEWFKQIGEGVVDSGNPCGEAKTVMADGTVKNGGSGITGYSILKLESMDVAVKVAGMCPVLEMGASVEVYEVIPTM